MMWVLLYVVGAVIATALLQTGFKRMLMADFDSWDTADEVLSWVYAGVLAQMWPICAVVALLALSAKWLQRKVKRLGAPQD